MFQLIDNQYILRICASFMCKAVIILIILFANIFDFISTPLTMLNANLSVCPSITLVVYALVRFIHQNTFCINAG